MPSPNGSSIVAVPVEADASALRAAIGKALPWRLWTIKQHSSRCVAPQWVNILGKMLKLMPPISYTIVGGVARGPIALRGAGKEIIADVPLHAQISARDVGGLLVALDNSPGFAALIADSLAQNFTKDVNELLSKVRRAIAEKREGAILIRSNLQNMQIGVLHAYGQGYTCRCARPGRRQSAIGQGNNKQLPGCLIFANIQ